jgi:hypothetical protein
MYIYLPALGYTPLLVVFLYVHIRPRQWLIQREEDAA